MTVQITKDDAVKVLNELTAIHATKEYFKKADIVSHDIGFGVDIWVYGEKWREAKTGLSTDLVPSRINKVPICVLVIG